MAELDPELAVGCSLLDDEVPDGKQLAKTLAGCSAAGMNTTP
jgi:hypothetical protein